jgi:Zn-dependent protease with chaperone function
VIFKAIYFDGINPDPKEVDLRVHGDQLVIESSSYGIHKNWLLKEVLVESKDQNEFYINHHDEQLICSNQDKALKDLLTFREATERNLIVKWMLYGVAIVSILVVLFSYLIPIISEKIPQSILDKTTAPIHQELKVLYCQVDEKEEKVLRKIFKKLNYPFNKEKILFLKIDHENAITLADHSIIFFSELMEKIQSGEEFAGILAHERAHVIYGHVKKKILTQLIIDFFWNLTLRNAGNLELIKAVGMSRFDQKEEKDADFWAFNNLEAQDIDPKPVSLFFKRLKKEVGLFDKLSFSHPDLDSRIQLFSSSNKKFNKSLISPDELQILQGICDDKNLPEVKKK